MNIEDNARAIAALMAGQGVRYVLIQMTGDRPVAVTSNVTVEDATALCRASAEFMQGVPAWPIHLSADEHKGDA